MTSLRSTDPGILRTQSYITIIASGSIVCVTLEVHLTYDYVIYSDYEWQSHI